MAEGPLVAKETRSGFPETLEGYGAKRVSPAGDARAGIPASAPHGHSQRCGSGRPDRCVCPSPRPQRLLRGQARLLLLLLAGWSRPYRGLLGHFSSFVTAHASVPIGFCRGLVDLGVCAWLSTGVWESPGVFDVKCLFKIQ